MENGIQVVQGLLGRIAIKLENKMIVSMKKEVRGHSGFFEIYEASDGSFSMLEEKTKKEVITYIEKEFRQFEKEKGEIVVVITEKYKRKLEMSKRIKKHLKIFTQLPEKGILESYYERDHYGENHYFCYMIRDEQKKKQDLQFFKNLNEAIHSCTNEGYVLYGKWDQGCFDFSFYNKDYRRLTYCLEEEKYCLCIEEMKIVLQDTSTEEIKKNIIEILEEIKKKERLQHLFQKEEKMPRPFTDFFENVERETPPFLLKYIWKELRRVCSYEELEKETYLQLRQGKTFQKTLNKGMWIGKFIEHYIAYDHEDFTYVVTKDKERFVEDMARFYKEQWKKEVENIGKDLA